MHACDGGVFVGAAGSQSTGSDQTPANKHCLHTSSQIKRSVSLQFLEVDGQVCVHAQVTHVYVCTPISTLLSHKATYEYEI